MTSRPIKLGTKAETLERLAPLLTAAYTMPLVAFTVADWQRGPAAILARIAKKLGSGRLIVRSSARSEDSETATNAGAYRSVAGVDGGDERALTAAIDDVIASYGARDRARDRADQVLVQQQLDDVELSGVMFTRDLTTLAPYFVFNYDQSGRTDSVTSGRGGGLQIYVRFRSAREPFPRPDLKVVFDAVDEIMRLAGDALEIELAVDGQGRVCVFQVRRLVARPAVEPPTEVALADWLVKAGKKLEKLSRPHPHLHGTRSVFGVMPDWNPAEIIGCKPRALALTLYKEIVTDSIWAYMRDNYGYRNLRSFPLLVSILGVPYIDVRVSFNSFVPKGVRDALSQKLVNYYVDRLVRTPESHDKVEFDIVYSCYYPGIRRDVATLERHGFSGTEVGELLSALRDLTNHIIHPAHGLWRPDLAKIETLKARHRTVVDGGMSAVDKIYWLLEDCKRYGTLPFSGLARAAFIAVQFLQGLVKLGIFSRTDYDAFLRSLDTITNRMGADVARLRAGRLGREDFLREYGHLRPGTYDILSPRYDEAFDRYFGGVAEAPGPERPRPAPIELSAAQHTAVAEVLREEGLTVTPGELFEFIRAAIEGREYAKLVFTRSLSDALVQLEALGAQCRLTRDDLSHLNIRKVLELYSVLDALDLRDVLLRDIEANREAHRITQTLRLPDLILSPADVFHFHTGKHEPNFVTLGKVTAEVVPEDALATATLAGKVVCIRAADPGYDWIFSRGVGGLVTRFGGANSHMAIRAAEQGIPAVIGCGETEFEAWSGAAAIEIDCANRTVRVLRERVASCAR